MFNCYHEPPATSYNDLESDRGKKNQISSKWSCGTGAGIQPTNIHTQNQETEVWQSKPPFIGVPNPAAKCSCPSCYQLPENQSYQGDLAWHRSWFSRSYPISASHDLKKLQANHHWENGGITGESYAAPVGAQYLQEDEDECLFYKAHPGVRHAEIYQPGVITTVKNSKVTMKDEIPKQEEVLSDVGLHTRFVPSNFEHDSLRNVMTRRRVEEGPNCSNQSDKFLNVESCRQQSNIRPYHMHPARRAILEPFSKTVPSNMNQNRVPSIGLRNIKDSVFTSYIDQNGIGNISSYNMSKVVSKEKHNRSLYQSAAAKEFNPGQENVLTDFVPSFTSGSVDYRGMNFNRELHSGLDNDLQKYLNNRNPQYFPRNEIAETMKRNGQNFVLDTRKDFNLNRKGVINSPSGSPRAGLVHPKHAEMGLSRSPKFRSCGMVDKMSSDVQFVFSRKDSLENFQKSNENIILRHPGKPQVEPSNSFVGEKVYGCMSLPNTYKQCRRPNYSYDRRDIQSQYDYPNGIINDLPLGINQEIVPNFSEIRNGFDGHHRLNNNVTYDNAYHQYDKFQYQMNGENKLQTPILTGSQTTSACTGGPETIKGPEGMNSHISHLETIRSDELSKNGTSKISPLRLLRKKKFISQKKDEITDSTAESTVSNTKNSTSPLDVRRFWATWAEEEEDNVPQTQMVVLDCHNIDPEQAGLLHLYESEPIRTLNLEDGSLIDIKTSQMDNQTEFDVAALKALDLENPDNQNNNINKTDSIDSVVDKSEESIMEEKIKKSSCEEKDLWNLEYPVHKPAVNSTGEEPDTNNKVDATCLENNNPITVAKQGGDDIKKPHDINESEQKVESEEDRKCDNQHDISDHMISCDFSSVKENISNEKEIKINDIRERCVKEEAESVEKVDNINKESSSDCSDDSQNGDISSQTRLPTSEYRKNKFLDYSVDNFENDSLCLENRKCTVPDAENFEIGKNEMDEEDRGASSFKPALGGPCNVDIDDILKKISDINFQSPESYNNVSDRVKTEKKLIEYNKDKKTKKLFHKSSRTDQVTVQNISLSKPTIKFSIQKSHDLKISFKVLNNKKKYEKNSMNEIITSNDYTDKHEFSSESMTDMQNIERIKKNRRRLITLKVKGLSNENENNMNIDENGNGMEKSSKGLKKKKIRFSRSPSPKTPILKIKKSRYLLNNCSNTDETEETYNSSEMFQKSESEGTVLGDFQVHETVDSAKIKLTFKRNKNNVDLKKNSCEIQNLENEVICHEGSIINEKRSNVDDVSTPTSDDSVVKQATIEETPMTLIPGGGNAIEVEESYQDHMVQLSKSPDESIASPSGTQGQMEVTNEEDPLKICTEVEYPLSETGLYQNYGGNINETVLDSTSAQGSCENNGIKAKPVVSEAVTVDLNTLSSLDIALELNEEKEVGEIEESNQTDGERSSTVIDVEDLANPSLDKAECEINYSLGNAEVRNDKPVIVVKSSKIPCETLPEEKRTDIALNKGTECDNGNHISPKNVENVEKMITNIVEKENCFLSNAVEDILEENIESEVSKEQRDEIYSESRSFDFVCEEDGGRKLRGVESVKETSSALSNCICGESISHDSTEKDFLCVETKETFVVHPNSVVNPKSPVVDDQVVKNETETVTRPISMDNVDLGINVLQTDQKINSFESQENQKLFDIQNIGRNEGDQLVVIEKNDRDAVNENNEKTFDMVQKDSPILLDLQTTFETSDILHRNSNNIFSREKTIFLKRKIERRCSTESRSYDLEPTKKKIRNRSISLNMKLSQIEPNVKQDDSIMIFGPEDTSLLDIEVWNIPLPLGEAPAENCFNIEEYISSKLCRDVNDSKFDEKSAELFFKPVSLDELDKTNVPCTEPVCVSQSPQLNSQEYQEKELNGNVENCVADEIAEIKKTIIENSVNTSDIFTEKIQEELEIHIKVNPSDSCEKITSTDNMENKYEILNDPDEILSHSENIDLDKTIDSFVAFTEVVSEIEAKDTELVLEENSLKTGQLYEGEGLVFDESLTIADDMEDEKVSDDDKFRNIMQNCIENAKKFLSDGNLKLFSGSVDDLLEICSREDEVESKNHITKDVLLTTCEESGSEDLVPGDRQSVEMCMDFMPSFFSDPGSNLCPEILPVDNWPYLEEEVASSPIINKREESDLISTHLENNSSEANFSQNERDVRNEIFGQKRLNTKSRRVSLCVTKGSTLLKSKQSPVAQRRKTIEGISRLKSFHNPKREISRSNDLIKTDIKNENFDLEEKELSSERNDSKSDNDDQEKWMSMNEDGEENHRQTVEIGNDTIRLPNKGIRNFGDIKSLSLQPKVVLFRISKNLIQNLSMIPKKNGQGNIDIIHKVPDQKIKGGKSENVQKHEITDRENEKTKVSVVDKRKSDTFISANHIPQVFPQDIKKKSETEKLSENGIKRDIIKRKKQRFRNLHSKKRIVPDIFDLAKENKSDVQMRSNQIDSESDSESSSPEIDLPKGSFISQGKSTKLDDLCKVKNIKMSHRKLGDALITKSIKKYDESDSRKSSPTGKDSMKHRRENKRKRDGFELKHNDESKKEKIHLKDKEKSRSKGMEDRKLNEKEKKSIGNDKSKRFDSIYNSFSKSKRLSDRNSYWICEVCGFSKSSERATHIQSHPFHCQSCHLAFKTETNFIEHLTGKHKDIRNQHHCLLCELSFDLEKDYYRHLETREHKHLESVEKNTINTLFTLLTGQPCPVLGPVETKPDWLPSQAGTVHFYHQATPLSLALQYLKLHRDKIATLSPKSE